MSAIEPVVLEPSCCYLQQEVQASSTLGNFAHTIASFCKWPAEFVSERLLRAVVTPIREGKEGNYQNRTIEIINRVATVVFTLASTPVTFPLFVGGEVFHLLGDQINKTPFVYWKGALQEKSEEKEISCMSLNTCMFFGGLPIVFGGLRPASHRMDDLVGKILEKKPDLLCLQEMSFSNAYTLFNKLKNEYSHCYTRIGPNPMRIESALTVFSKVKIESVEFVLFPKQEGMHRGAFFIETPSYYFVTTHLEAGDNFAMRKEQFDLITRKIEDNSKSKPTFILGDLNIDKFDAKQVESGKDEYKNTIGEKIKNADWKDLSSATCQGGSCTNVLDQHMRGKDLEEKPELDDYALLFSGQDKGIKATTTWIETYDNKQPYQAISDHKAICIEIKKNSSDEKE